MEMVFEAEKHDELLENMDNKINSTRKDLNNKIFDLRLTDLKSQFLVVKNIFEKVIYGSDDEELRKSRLDSAFVIWEELFLMISEPHSELFKHAHYCIDLASCFMIIHLGMLQMAVEWYDLKDHEERLEYCMEFYPILIKSYVEQAISNYVKPIILNYHNQYNSLNEMEELYYELTDSVIYKIKRNSEHFWWKTTKEDMFRDRMYYNFKEEKFKEIEPAFMIGPEPPVLWRALRYGVSLKLEDLYTQYLAGIDQIVHKLRNEVTEESEEDEFEELKFDKISDFEKSEPDEELKEEFNKENYDISPIKENISIPSSPQKVLPHENLGNKSLKFKRCQTMKIKEVSPIKKLDTTEEIKWEYVPVENYHYQQWVRVEKARKNINEVKKRAKKEAIMLNELFKIKAEEHNFYDLKDNISKLLFSSEFQEIVAQNSDVYENLSKYIIFHYENKRVKCFNHEGR